MQALSSIVLVACVAASGCATLARDDVQHIDIRVLGPDGRSISDAVCRLSNGTQQLAGNSPMMHTPIERSGRDLEIECRKPGLPVARAMASARMSSNVLVAIQPFSMTMVDHLTGRMYDYADRIDLVIGKEVLIERDGVGHPVIVRTMSLGSLADAANTAAIRELYR